MHAHFFCFVQHDLYHIFRHFNIYIFTWHKCFFPVVLTSKRIRKHIHPSISLAKLMLLKSKWNDENLQFCVFLSMPLKWLNVTSTDGFNPKSTATKLYICVRAANARFWLSSCSSVATATVCWGIHVTWNIKNSDISLNFHFAWRFFFFSRKTGASTHKYPYIHTEFEIFCICCRRKSLTL